MQLSRHPVGRLDLGIFLVSFAILLLELLLTRVFSVTMFYHFSFLAVSLAMTGLGASGLLLTLWPDRFPREALPRQAGAGAAVFALGAVIAVGIAFHVPVRLESTLENWRSLGGVLAIAVVPFLAGGFVIALLLSHHPERATRLYGLDLLGAACGCVAFIPLTNLVGAPTAILIAAGIGAMAGAVIGRGRACAIIAAGLLLLAAVNYRAGLYDIRIAKGEEQPDTLAVRWNSFSRVEVNGRQEDLTVPKAPLGFGYSAKMGDRRVREVYLRYDASAMTQITGFDGDLEDLDHLRYDVTTAGYHLRRHREVLVIGAGGGRDVLTAMAFGCADVTAVEVNPIPIDLLRGPFREFTGGIYVDHPGVEIVRDDGRSYVRGTGKRFDLIQASLVDTWAASSAGAYSLTENSLYTVEAMEDFLARLRPGGIISLSRWHDDPPAEVLRVVVLAREALRRRGVSDPASHILLLRTRSERTRYPSLGTILVQETPFTHEEVSRLRSWAAAMDFVVGDPLMEDLLGPRSSEMIASVPFDLGVVTDDRPFFFDRVPLLDYLGHRRGKLTLGGQTLLIALGVTVGFTLMMACLPLLGGGGTGRVRSLPWVVYFAALGAGYIGVEMVILQRFNLHLGHPALSLAAVLCTLLAASGLGSLVAGGRIPVIVAAVVGSLALHALVLPWTIDATLGSSTLVRVAAAVGTTAPIAFLMGMPFPMALRQVGERSRALVSWAWAVNGGASVSGSALALLVSMTCGFRAASWMGVMAYGVALAAAILALRQCPPSSRRTLPAE